MFALSIPTAFVTRQPRAIRCPGQEVCDRWTCVELVGGHDAPHGLKFDCVCEIEAVLQARRASEWFNRPEKSLGLNLSMHEKTTRLRFVLVFPCVPFTLRRTLLPCGPELPQRIRLWHSIRIPDSTICSLRLASKTVFGPDDEVEVFECTKP